VRYCDDFVILCTSRARAEHARNQVAAILATLGLRLHPDKTTIVHLAGGAGGFDFLGFHHRKRHPASGQTVGTCTSGPPIGRWPRSGPRSKTVPSAVM
jgi:hypothetical protein